MVDSFDPKPVALTQVDAVDYDGEFEPEPLIVVGPIPGMEGGTVDSVVAGTGITVDDTDPENPEISLTDTYVESVAAGTGISVDSTDPAAPEVSVDPAAFVAVDDTPADAAAVAADLIAVRAALIAAGLMAPS